MNPTFIFWYTLSMAWHPTLTTGILPFIALFYMNTQIFIGIRKSRQVSITSLSNMYQTCCWETGWNLGFSPILIAGSPKGA
jgi:hypothetical protein